MPDIVVTIPAYNEEKTIGNVLRDIQKTLVNEDYEVLVVSDGSTDKTVPIVRGLGVPVIDKPHRGLADTFRSEMNMTTIYNPNIIVHLDADGQYSANDIPKLIWEIRNGADLALGNRLSSRLENMPFSKKLFNRLGSIFFSLLIQQYIPDWTTGFRAFTPQVAKLRINSNYTYTIEQIIKSHLFNYKIKSCKVSSISRDGGKSKLMKNPAHYIWNTLKNFRSMYRV